MTSTEDLYNELRAVQDATIMTGEKLQAREEAIRDELNAIATLVDGDADLLDDATYTALAARLDAVAGAVRQVRADIDAHLAKVDKP